MGREGTRVPALDIWSLSYTDPMHNAFPWLWSLDSQGLRPRKELVGFANDGTETNAAPQMGSRAPKIPLFLSSFLLGAI